MTAADPEITVTYERKFSDGNFGSEGLSLSWTGPYTDDDDDNGDVDVVITARYAQIARGLRATVLTELAKSAAPRVATVARHELNPPPPIAPTDPVLEDIPF